jgi:hypothetical protein
MAIGNFLSFGFDFPEDMGTGLTKLNNSFSYCFPPVENSSFAKSLKLLTQIHPNDGLPLIKELQVHLPLARQSPHALPQPAVAGYPQLRRCTIFVHHPSSFVPRFACCLLPMASFDKTGDKWLNGNIKKQSFSL